MFLENFSLELFDTSGSDFYVDFFFAKGTKSSITKVIPVNIAERNEI